MILFNYSAIYLLAKGDSSLIVSYLQAIALGNYQNLKGLNFLVNTTLLFNDKYSDREKAEFVGLCSLRNFSDFKLQNKTNLHISRIPPWVSKYVVENNPLIEINQPNLIFITEGITK
jgi:hypothetical protein